MRREAVRAPCLHLGILGATASRPANTLLLEGQQWHNHATQNHILTSFCVLAGVPSAGLAAAGQPGGRRVSTAEARTRGMSESYTAPAMQTRRQTDRRAVLGTVP